MADYRSTLTGTQMDSALLDMAEHNSEAYAVGERNGIAVASDDVTYHNNARYYAQIASSQIVGDASSAVRWDTDQSEALTDAQKAQARENINAASDSDVVKITAQTLTSAQQEQARANIAAGGSNRNLLDNPFFTINQRDVAVGVNVNANGFVADRWQATGASGAKRNSDGSITITNTMSHKIATTVPVGKTVTISALYADGTIEHDTFTWTGTTTRYLGSLNAVCYTAATPQQINFTTATKNVSALKLELGAVSTLANDAPPDSETELIKCRGYFERIHSLGSSEIVGMGMGVSASSVRIGIPSLICHTIQSVTYSGGGLLLEGGGNYRTLTSIGRLNATPKNGFLTVTCGSSDAITPYQTYALVGTAAGGYIDISADL